MQESQGHRNVSYMTLQGVAQAGRKILMQQTLHQVPGKAAASPEAMTPPAFARRSNITEETPSCKHASAQLSGDHANSQG